MKKVILTLGLALVMLGAAQAAIVTNTNQSTAFIRMLSRNATTDIDAVYYNPAGLVKLADGWHLYLSNETVFQTKTVVNDYPLLNNGNYEGEVKVPIYPDAYVAWKKGKIVISFGFGPNAGGGAADYKTGLPQFETAMSTLPYLISSMGIPTTAYSADITFKGSSAFLGYQANVSYAVTDTFSLAAGIRYISAKNTYEGHLSSVMINPNFPALGMNGSMISAQTFFQTLGAYGIMNPAVAAYYAAQVADKTVDAEQTGSGFTPIFSAHFNPIPELAISARYELKTALELTNKTTEDGTGLFDDGDKTHQDIPAFLALGADYGLSPDFRASLSFSYFFDKDADWDGREDLLEKNSYDLSVGLEYDITDMFTLSAGYMYSFVGVTDDYQSDMAYDLKSDTFGFGGRINLSPDFDIDLGVLFTSYKDYSKDILYAIGAYRELYKQKTFVVSVGASYHFGGQVTE